MNNFFQDSLNDMMGFHITACETIGRQLAEYNNPNEHFASICYNNGIDPNSLTDAEREIILNSWIRNSQ